MPRPICETCSRPLEEIKAGTEEHAPSCPENPANHANQVTTSAHEKPSTEAKKVRNRFDHSSDE
jgi:hypothetical protein